MDEKNGMKIIDGLAKILPVLYTNPNVLAGKFSLFNTTIQRMFPNTNIAEHSREVLHLDLEAATLRRTDYAAKVFAQHGQQRQLLDSEVLERINTLRTKTDWESLIVCVALAVGSRLIEIVSVSRYSPANSPIYITIEGVAKDKHDPEFKDEEDGKQENKRKFVKPILGGILSDELIRMVDSIREQVSIQFDVSLGPEYKGRELTRRQITGLVDRKANLKMREMFGEGYVLHDARAIYAQLAYIQFAPPSISQTYYYSQVLGHAENSLTTALSYQKFAIRKKLQEDDPGLVDQITTLNAEFRAMKQEQKQQVAPKEEKVAPKLINEQKEIHFQDSKGEIFSIRKQNRIRAGNDNERLERLKKVVELLETKGVQPTYKILKKLGFGTRVITKLKKQKDET